MFTEWMLSNKAGVKQRGFYMSNCNKSKKQTQF